MGRYLLFIRPLEAELSGINSVIEHRSPNFAKGGKKGVVPRNSLWEISSYYHRFSGLSQTFLSDESIVLLDAETSKTRPTGFLLAAAATFQFSS